MSVRRSSALDTSPQRRRGVRGPRSRAYAAARDDIDRATRIRTKVQGIDDPPIAMTRARWLIGTGAP